MWQLKWNQQELGFTGEAKSESLFSVGEDGRFRKWSVFSGGLDCEGTIRGYEDDLLSLSHTVLVYIY